ncbi:hypothetical protein Zmor_001460 [Zophobas morio]|uniref:Uncharacterized protein n=1 Tax=Zophobas morio TaxID=2755281 RepID=A0AA38IZ56_9CUCU|nr:hypothetical protein Zmor_001460 [Zophobas morio]
MRSLNVALVVINRRVEKTNGSIKCGKQVFFECYSHPWNLTQGELSENRSSGGSWLELNARALARIQNGNRCFIIKIFRQLPRRYRVYTLSTPFLISLINPDKRQSANLPHLRVRIC